MKLAHKTEEAPVAEMAEDPRYRSNDPFARPQGAGSGGDPLAELARLIGQNDPFSDFNRNAARAPAPPERAEAPSLDWRSTPAPDPFRNAQPAAPPAYTDPYAGHGAHAAPAEPHYNGHAYAGQGYP